MTGANICSICTASALASALGIILIFLYYSLLVQIEQIKKKNFITPPHARRRRPTAPGERSGERRRVFFILSALICTREKTQGNSMLKRQKTSADGFSLICTGAAVTAPLDPTP